MQQRTPNRLTTGVVALSSIESGELAALPVVPPAQAPAAPWLVLAMDGSPGFLAAEGAGPVTRVAVGSVFIRMLREITPRLVVMSAPPAGAAEMLAAVAERRRRPTLRLVLLNDPSDVSGRLRALALGFDEALPASVAPEELVGRAQLLLDAPSRAPATPQIAIAPGVQLDLGGRRVRRAGTEIHLRPREYALLAVLATHPGRVFTRRELVDRAWGAGYTGGPRTVDVHVRWLRAKIEQDPERPAHIVTVRGAGYRLDPPAG